METAVVKHRNLIQRDGLRAAVIVEGQTKARAVEGNENGIADGDIFGIPLRSILRHGDGVSPNAYPMLLILHGNSPYLSFSFFHTIKLGKNLGLSFDILAKPS